MNVYLQIKWKPKKGKALYAKPCLEKSNYSSMPYVTSILQKIFYIFKLNTCNTGLQRQQWCFLCYRQWKWFLAVFRLYFSSRRLYKSTWGFIMPSSHEATPPSKSPQKLRCCQRAKKHFFRYIGEIVQVETLFFWKDAATWWLLFYW